MDVFLEIITQINDKVNQSLGYVHFCFELIILIKMSTNNPSWWSVVLESSVKPSMGYHWQPRCCLIKHLRTTDYIL